MRAACDGEEAANRLAKTLLKTWSGYSNSCPALWRPSAANGLICHWGLRSSLGEIKAWQKQVKGQQMLTVLCDNTALTTSLWRFVILFLLQVLAGSGPVAQRQLQATRDSFELTVCIILSPNYNYMILFKQFSCIPIQRRGRWTLCTSTCWPERFHAVSSVAFLSKVKKSFGQRRMLYNNRRVASFTR